MADSIYLSLWFPNLRLEAMGEVLATVLGQVAAHGGSPAVSAATVYPVGWSEPPVFQRIYEEGEPAAAIPDAVAEALEMLHEDYAYEFEMGWQLWEPESGAGLDALWRRQQRRVRVAAFGPLFEDGVYRSEGQVRIDFGRDSAFLGAEESGMDAAAAARVEQNVRQLVDLTRSLEKSAGIESRRLWSESGESLAERLLARRERGN
jgi:hypothetical protein